MDIDDMHITFRELGQQMGMQTTRAILAEDIDICLNAAIIAKARSVLAENVGTIYSDKIARQNAAISPVNALRTLYTENLINGSSITGEGSEIKPYMFNVPTDKVMLFTGFTVSYNNKTMYDCRIIEYERLGQTLRDFCSRAAKDAPIVCITGEDRNIKVNLYTGRTQPTKPQTVKYIYIREPAKVYYDEDNTHLNVNCDLPPYLHMEIVESAVKYYLASIGAVAGTKKNNE